MSEVLLSTNLQLLIFASSVLVPILHSLITKANASDQSKVLMTLVLTAVASLLAMWIDTGGVLNRETFIVWGLTFVGAITAHYGLTKPLTITGSDGKVQALTSGKGVALAGSEAVAVDEAGQELPWEA